jgi:hypothetical protein
MRMAREYYQLDLLNRGHENCQHSKYALSCHNYEVLLERSNGRCEMCGIFGVENQWRKLFIDHDPRHGYWAVRGLLCWLCNFEMEYQTTNFPEGKARLLAHPFYLDLLDKYGVGLRMDEPPIGSAVFDSKGRQWVRLKRGWETSTHRRQTRTRDWHYLHYQHGPHILGQRLQLPS